MRAAAGYILVAALLAGAGLLLLRGSQLEERLAAAERDLVTLRYAEAGERAAEPLPSWAAVWPGGEKAAQDAATLQATSQYWQGDYEQVAANPRARLQAANAAYRALRREGGDWKTVVSRLDGVVKGYAEVLREEPDNTEAAFNFEYATRLRATIAARRQNLPPQDALAGGVTIHGGVGAVPTEADAKKFKMIVPMRPDERQEAEKAGKGATKVRKG